MEISQDVSAAAQGVDQPRSVSLDFAPELLDVNVQGVGDKIIILAPDLLVEPRPLADASEQLFEGKRLAEVIVGAAIKSSHTVADRVSRRE